MKKLISRALSCWMAGLLLCCSASFAADYTDHPLLSGLAAFEIRSKSDKPFDVYTVDVSDIAQVKSKKYTGPTSFEGHVTQLVYSTKIGAKSSVLEVYKNYVAAIEKLGGKQINTPAPGELNYDHHIFQIPQPGRQPVSVVLRIPYDTEYYLTIVEPAAMVQSVQAGELAKEIAADGRATLYINFDNNKSDLKEDGLAAVKEIVKLLNQQPKMRISIEGHTDNIGDAAVNRKLSQARAEAVLAAVKAQGIDAKRLAAKGHGADIPVADNRKEDGRAKNRRVELVKLP